MTIINITDKKREQPKAASTVILNYRHAKLPSFSFRVNDGNCNLTTKWANVYRLEVPPNPDAVLVPEELPLDGDEKNELLEGPEPEV